MSLCDRRLFLVAGLALAGCGFQPVHQSGGAGEAFLGKIALQNARTPVDFAFRERLRRTFGDAGGAADWQFVYDLTLNEVGSAIEQDLDVTRFTITGTAKFALKSLSGEDDVEEQSVIATSSFDAIADTFATRSARQAAEARLAEELAERAATRLYALAGS